MERGALAAPVLLSSPLVPASFPSHWPGDTPSLLPPRASELSVPPAWIRSSSRNPRGSPLLEAPSVSSVHSEKTGALAGAALC